MNNAEKVIRALQNENGYILDKQYVIDNEGMLYMEAIGGRYSGSFTDFCSLSEITKIVIEEDEIKLISFDGAVDVMKRPTIKECLIKLDKLCVQMGITPEQISKVENMTHQERMDVLDKISEDQKRICKELKAMRN